MRNVALPLADVLANDAAQMESSGATKLAVEVHTTASIHCIGSMFLTTMSAMKSKAVPTNDHA